MLKREVRCTHLFWAKGKNTSVTLSKIGACSDGPRGVSHQTWLLGAPMTLHAFTLASSCWGQKSAQAGQHRCECSRQPLSKQ